MRLFLGPYSGSLVGSVPSGAPARLFTGSSGISSKCVGANGSTSALLSVCAGALGTDDLGQFNEPRLT